MLGAVDLRNLELAYGARKGARRIISREAERVVAAAAVAEDWPAPTPASSVACAFSFASRPLRASVASTQCGQLLSVKLMTCDPWKPFARKPFSRTSNAFSETNGACGRENRR